MCVSVLFQKVQSQFDVKIRAQINPFIHSFDQLWLMQLKLIAKQKPMICVRVYFVMQIWKTIRKQWKICDILCLF